MKKLSVYIQSLSQCCHLSWHHWGAFCIYCRRWIPTT